MKPSLFLILALSWLLHISEVKAQEPVHLHLTEKEGLPDKEFYGLAEDSKGFLWLAGNKGLTRFDGTEFTMFEHPEKRGLSVFELNIDAKDRAWTVNISGQVFYAQGEELVLFADAKEHLRGSLPSLLVTSKNVVLTTGFVCLIYNIETKKLTKNQIDSDFLGYPIMVNDVITLSFNNTLFEVKNDVLEKKYPLPLQLENTTKERFGIIRHALLPNGVFILFSNNEKQKSIIYSLTKEVAQKIKVPEAIQGLRLVNIKAIDDTVYFLTNKGAFATVYDGKDFKISQQYLKDVFITDTTKDKDGNIWFSTLNDGVYVLPNIAIKNIVYPESLGQPTAIAVGKENSLLIGFNKGNVLVYRDAPQDKTIVNLPSKRGISTLYYNPQIAQNFYAQDIITYNAVAENPTKFNALNNDIVSVKKMTALPQDRIAWVNSGQGEISNTVDFFAPYDQAKSLFKIEKRGYTVFYNQAKELLYFGMVDELVAVDASYKKKSIRTNDGKNILTRSITQTNDGYIWVATFTDGIFKIKEDTVVAHFNEQNDLISNRVNVIKAHKNNLWISTDRGIQLLDRSTNAGRPVFKNLKKQDGIPSYDIKGITAINNTIYFASSSSVFSIDTQQVFRETARPQLYFKSIIIDKEEVAIQQDYTIKEEESSMQIRFNANGFRGLSSGNFKYRLKGYDNDWTAIKQGTNNIQFASLPTGKFTFELAPVDEKLQETSNASFNISVVQPFYKTFWFWGILMGILIAAIVYYYNKSLKRQAKKQKQQQEELQLANQLTALKLENLQSQMNPHFIFNALNSIQEYIVHNEKDLASSYLVKFSRLIRMYLDQSRENNITLEEELEAMSLYLQLEKVRFEDKLNYTIQYDKSIPVSQIIVPPLFIQPYLENALKHGLLHRKDNRCLLVKFTYNISEKILCILVEDNGIGRQAAMDMKAARPAYHKSFATYANNERVSLLNKNRNHKIKVITKDLKDGNQALGTQIYIEVPQ